MRSAVIALAVLAAAAPAARAQAPDWADFWRVIDGTLSVPGAVASGPTAMFWNPAAITGHASLSAGLDVLQTPDAVNMSGVLLGAGWGFGDRAGVGAIAGRTSIGDLIRTSSSPVSEGSEIPVFAQFLGGGIGGQLGPVAVGAAVLVHDARLDALSEGGLTVDVGVRITPATGLVLGASSHFGDPVATVGPAAAYLFGADWGLHVPDLLGLAARLHLRYGLTLREVGEPEHLGSGGLELAERVLIDLAAQRIGGYGEAAWQPVLAIAFRAGRYRVGISRGSGASGIGAAYRLSLGIVPDR